MGNDKGRLLQVLYHIGHGKRLARTRDTQQCLGLVPLSESFGQRLDRLRLITGGLIFRMQFEFHIRYPVSLYRSETL